MSLDEDEVAPPREISAPEALIGPLAPGALIGPSADQKHSALPLSYRMTLFEKNMLDLFTRPSLGPAKVVAHLLMHDSKDPKVQQRFNDVNSGVRIMQAFWERSIRTHLLQRRVRYLPKVVGELIRQSKIHDWRSFEAKKPERMDSHWSILKEATAMIDALAVRCAELEMQLQKFVGKQFVRQALAAYCMRKGRASWNARFPESPNRAAGRVPQRGFYAAGVARSSDAAAAAIAVSAAIDSSDKRRTHINKLRAARVARFQKK